MKEIKPRAIVCSKRPDFQSKSYQPPILNDYLAKLYWHFSRIIWYSRESSIGLQSCTAFYSCKQNADIINEIKLNISFILMINYFSFVSFTNFKLEFKILIEVFSILNLKLLKFNIKVTYLCHLRQNKKPQKAVSNLIYFIKFLVLLKVCHKISVSFEMV